MRLAKYNMTKNLQSFIIHPENSIKEAMVKIKKMELELF